MSAIKPVSSGTVNINDAIAKARDIAVERGIDLNRDIHGPSPPFLSARVYADRGGYIDTRVSSRGYRRSRSPSRTPPRSSRENFRDNYNPYRDERRAGADRLRDRSYSPRRDGRFSPAYGDRSPIRARAETDSEILPIEKSLVGLIIGRSGENLRRVENQTGARVQFMDGPESVGVSRHCRISGSRSARAAAKSEIFRIIEDNEAAKRGQSTSRSSQMKSVSNSTPVKEADSLQIMVPDRTVGLIIGRGGETIRDLQDRSGCHVNIVGENKSVNGMRPVNLIGPIHAQQRAKDLIYEIVESDNKGTSIKAMMGREDPYTSGPDKINDSVMVPGEAVGMIIGKGGETIKEMQNQTGCKINVSPATGRDIEREIGLVGTRNAIDAAKRAIMEKVDAVEARNRANREDRSDAYGDRYPGQQAPPSYPPPGMLQDEQPGLAAPAGGGDPYAAYGGYQNYIALWYAAMQQQQQGQTQQPAHGQGEQR